MPAPTVTDRSGRLAALWAAVVDTLCSLKLSVVLLVLGMILVFAATLDQVNLGIWAVQEKYFRAFVVYGYVGPVAVPLFPGGYTIGGLLLANLAGAFVARFSFAWRKAGIALAHAGLIVLLVGELLTGLWQKDYYLRLDEGQTRNYAESYRDYELALTDTTDAAFDAVVSIPAERLADKTPIAHAQLPFRVVPRVFFANSTLQPRRGNGAGALVAATHGAGLQLAAAPQPFSYQPKAENFPAAYVELAGPDGTVGTFLAAAQLEDAQEFTHAGRTWRLALRPRRAYQPFSLTLLKFTHDRYPGTQIPKNFSSTLRLDAGDGRPGREVVIYMNNPLRHAGLTFYQAGFANNDRTTVLQVVRNPSWLMPYVACGLMSLGLLLQFGLHLAKFAGRRIARPVPAAA